MRVQHERAQLLEQRATQLEREAEWQAAAAVAEERARIAREAHDALAHSVSVMTLRAAGVRGLLQHEQQAHKEALPWPAKAPLVCTYPAAASGRSGW